MPLLARAAQSKGALAGNRAPAAQRRFRGDIALTRKTPHAQGLATEDAALTQYLLLALQEARSLSLKPPACVYCHSNNTVLAGKVYPRRPMPAFQCQSCLRRFNRLSRTPLARLRHAQKLPMFIRLLSCQMSYKQAGELLEVDYTAIANWAEKFRTWLLQLDASGAWEARVRLGIKPQPLAHCPQCAKAQHVRFCGFNDAGARRLICRACERTWQVSREDAAHELETTVAHDPRVTHLRRMRAVARARLASPSAIR